MPSVQSPSVQSLQPAPTWVQISQDQPANDTTAQVDGELLSSLTSLDGDGLRELRILESENCRLLGQLTRRRLERS